MKVLKIISKNFKLLLRSRSSSLIVILGPLVVILFAGIAFNNASTYNIKVGFYSPTYNDLTNSYINKIAAKYPTTKYPSQESCIEDIKMGVVHTCVIFPENLGIQNNVSNDLVFYADYSRINLVYSVIETISSSISQRSSEISSDLTSILVTKLDYVRKEVSAKQANLDNLTTQNSNIKTQTSTVSSKISKIDTSFNVDDYKVNDLRGQISSQLSSIGGSAASAKLKINDAKDRVAAINTSSVSAIISSLDSAIESLNSITAATNSSTSNTSSVSSMLNNIETKLASAKSQLNSIAATKTETLATINEINSLLDSSKQQIDILKASFEDIKKSIDSIQVTNVENIVNPVTTRISPVASEKTHLDYLFPSLIVLIIMIVSLLLATILVQMEKSSRAFFRNFITPTLDITFFTGTFITVFIVLSIQLAIILGVSTYYFKLISVGSLPELIFILTIVVSFFTVVGMYIGYLFNSIETATLASVSAGSVLLFLSSLILPMESMPAYVLQIAKYNPFVISDTSIRKVVLFATPLQNMRIDISLMAGYCILVFLAVFVQMKLIRKRFYTKFIMKLVPRFSLHRKKK